jgi:hypothetical protein
MASGCSAILHIKAPLMELGGIDFTISCPMTAERLLVVLDVVCQQWPLAHFEEDESGSFSRGAPPSIPCTIFAHRTVIASEAIEREGVTEALEDEMICLYVEPNELHLVIGNLGSEADLIRREIESTLRASLSPGG